MQADLQDTIFSCFAPCFWSLQKDLPILPPAGPPALFWRISVSNFNLNSFSASLRDRNPVQLSLRYRTLDAIYEARCTRFVSAFSVLGSTWQWESQPKVTQIVREELPMDTKAQMIDTKLSVLFHLSLVWQTDGSQSQCMYGCPLFQKVL